MIRTFHTESVYRTLIVIRTKEVWQPVAVCGEESGRNDGEEAEGGQEEDCRGMVAIEGVLLQESLRSIRRKIPEYVTQ